MYRLVGIMIMLLLGVMGVRRARADDASDARVEMAAALQAQADLHPSPAALPIRSAAPQHAAAPSAIKRGLNQRAASEVGARAIEQAHAIGASQALVHQAQAAAAAAAGQAQGQAAKQRASRPHPTPQAR
jgi:hypothetical protein